MANVKTRPERDQLVFTGPGGNPAGIISEADCISAGIHDGTTWHSTKFQVMTAGDLMHLAGFHERTPPPRNGAKQLTESELATVVKALELHTGMNYYNSGSHGGDYEMGFACEACCTCF